jgi:hypothetical protein
MRLANDFSPVMEHNCRRESRYRHSWIRRNMPRMNTNKILSSLRKQKKKIDRERERLHRAIVAFEKRAGKAVATGEKKYKMSRARKKKTAAGQR